MDRTARSTLRRIVCVCALLLGVAAAARAQQRIPCAELIREFDHVVSLPGTGAVDPIKVGKKLGVDPLWVERCATTYGRRLSRPPRRAGLAKEDQDLHWETQEPEEFAREEFETRGDEYVQELEGDVQKRRYLQRFDRDSSAEWNPLFSHEWRPTTSLEWTPYMLNERFKLDD